MQHHHLTDDEVQSYLDNPSSTEKFQIESHIENCTRCERLLLHYKNIFESLEIDPNFRLPKSFAKTVASKVFDQGTPLFTPRTELLMIITGVLMVLGAMIFFVDLKPIAQSLQKMTLQKIDIIGPIVEPLKNLLAGLNGSVALLPFAGLALAFVAIIDRLIQKHKRHKLTF